MMLLACISSSLMAEPQISHSDPLDVRRVCYCFKGFGSTSFLILIFQVKVVFCGTGMVKVNAIRSIAADVLSQETITGLILVLQSHVTNQALKAIELFSFKVEIFQVYKYIYFPNLICVGTTSNL